MNEIPIKSARDIEGMRVAGRVTREILEDVAAYAVEGESTGALNHRAAMLLNTLGAASSFLGYAPPGCRPFPAVLCTSRNSEVGHGIPNNFCELRAGDLLKLDFAAIVDGWHGDTALTIPIGQVDSTGADLLDATHAAMVAGIEQMVPGRRLSDIGEAIENRADRRSYRIVEKLSGHGIGRAMHEPPLVPNFGPPGRGPRLRAGMVFAIEPMLTTGSPAIELGIDGWTVNTRDGARSAHFEHTVLITDHGPEILTAL